MISLQPMLNCSTLLMDIWKITIVRRSSKLAIAWQAKAYKGQLYFFDMNVHNFFDSPFFKDQDSVLFENNKTKQSFAVDPKVADYFFIQRVAHIK